MMIMGRWKYALHMTCVNTALLVPNTFTITFIIDLFIQKKTRPISDY